MNRRPPKSTRTDNTLSLHDALPISIRALQQGVPAMICRDRRGAVERIERAHIRYVARRVFGGNPLGLFAIDHGEFAGHRFQWTHPLRQLLPWQRLHGRDHETGTASCREREWQYV